MNTEGGGAHFHPLDRAGGSIFEDIGGKNEIRMVSIFYPFSSALPKNVIIFPNSAKTKKQKFYVGAPRKQT